MPGKKAKTSKAFVDGFKAIEVQDIPLEDIKEDLTFQYRLSASVGDLRRSLEVEGQQEPIDLTGAKPYRIIDGFRRVEAMRSLGWPVVKALVHRGITDNEAHKVAFIKNVVRKNLSPMDKANAIFQAKQRGMKEAEVEEYFGISEKQIARYENLLDFPPEIQKLLEKETIPMGHAKVLADFRVKEKDIAGWVQKIQDNDLSAKQLKKELKKASGVRMGGKPKLYMRKEKNGFRMFPFAISKDAPQSEKDKVSKLLQEALELLKG